MTGLTFQPTVTVAIPTPYQAEKRIYSVGRAWITGVTLGSIALAAIAGLLLYKWKLKRGEPVNPDTAPMKEPQLGALQHQVYQPWTGPWPASSNPLEHHRIDYFNHRASAPYSDHSPTVTPDTLAELEGQETRDPVEAPTEPMSPTALRNPNRLKRWRWYLTNAI